MVPNGSAGVFYINLQTILEKAEISKRPCMLWGNCLTPVTLSDLLAEIRFISADNS